MFSGAFCSGSVEKYGSRPVAMLGSFIAAVALFGGAFANSLTALYIIYGIAGGGIGLSYVSFVVIIQQYFHKRRTIASGFTLTGFSIASFSLPPFTRWLIDLYGWRGTLMIISCFYLNGIVLAALLRPPPRRNLIKSQSSRRRTASFTQRLQRQMSFEKTKTEMSKCCTICRKVFDYRMFRDPRFVLYGMGTFFMTIGNIAFFMHLVNRALSLGISSHWATFLPSIYGIANGVCRMLFSVVANLPKCDKIIQYGVWIMAGGFIACMSTFATNFMGLGIVCGGFGMCVGAFICIQYPALVDLLGVHKIARSTGLLQIFIGAAGLIATPLAGQIYDMTNDYSIPYYVIGSIMMLGGAIVLIIPCLSHFRYNKYDHKTGRNYHKTGHNTPGHMPPKQKSVLSTCSMDVGKGAIIMSESNKGGGATESDDNQSTCKGRLRTLSSDSHHFQSPV